MNVEGTIMMCGRKGCSKPADAEPADFKATFPGDYGYTGFIYLCVEHRTEFDEVFRGVADSEGGQPKAPAFPQRHGINVTYTPDDPTAFYLRTMYCEWFYGPFATIDALLAAMTRLDTVDDHWDYDPFTVHLGANPLPDDHVSFPSVSVDDAERIRAHRKAEAERMMVQRATVPTVPTVPTTEDTQDLGIAVAMLCQHCPSIVPITEVKDHYLRFHGIKIGDSKEILH